MQTVQEDSWEKEPRTKTLENERDWKPEKEKSGKQEVGETGIFSKGRSCGCGSNVVR